MKKTNKYLFFWKESFSQWFRSKMVIDGIEYNCCEQYMMHQKAVIMKDYDTANKIMSESHPAHQKAWGRAVKGFKKELWDEKCLEIVFKGNYAKYTQNKELKKKLLDTAPLLLVEASPMDPIWGIAMHEDDKGIEDSKNWKGKNYLGETLTKVREAIAKEE